MTDRCSCTAGEKTSVTDRWDCAAGQGTSVTDKCDWCNKTAGQVVSREGLHASAHLIGELVAIAKGWS